VQNGVSIEQWRNTQNATNPQAFSDVSHIKANDAEHYWWLAPAAVQAVKEGVKRTLIPAAKWTGKKVVQGTKWAYNKVVGGGGKNVDDVLKNAKRGKKTKGKSKIFEKSGGFDQAKKDFYSLKPVKVVNRSRDGKKILEGILKDGKIIKVRDVSTYNNRPTIEIISNTSNSITKIRY
jgi:hypothetical protein